MGRPGKDSRQVLGTQTGELSDDDDVSGLENQIVATRDPNRWMRSHSGGAHHDDAGVETSGFETHIYIVATWNSNKWALTLVLMMTDESWRLFLKLNSFTIIYPEHFWSWSNWWSCCLLWRWTNHKSKIKNKKWFIPRDLSVLLQPADIVSKFRKQLKNVRSHKDFLLGWSIQLDPIWSIRFDRSWSIQFDQYDLTGVDQYNLIGVDQYIGNLTKWSMLSIWHDHWSIWSNDLACNFTVGGVVSTCDLNVFDVMCDTSQCDWDVRNESICDKEQSSIWSWKYLLPVIK